MASRNADSKNGGAGADLNEQIATLRRDIVKIADTLSDITAEKVSEIGESAFDKASSAASRGRISLERAGDSVRTLEADATDFVRRKPVRSLAIAAGLGLLVGYLTRRA